MPLPLFDTHCHLQDPRLDRVRDAVLARATDAGVTHMVCCGTCDEDWDAVLELARQRPGVVPMLGLHPWHIQDACSSWAAQLDHLARHHAVGIGECGLDFALVDADRPAQEAAFRLQLELARDLDRPLSIHCRRAWERLVVLAQETGLPAAGAVVHAYSGSPETARALQDLGFHLAFGCSLAHPDNRKSPAALRAVRENRLHFETDTPDLAPRHLPEYALGRPNEPANLTLVLDAAARILGVEPAPLAARIHANAMQVFRGILR